MIINNDENKMLERWMEDRMNQREEDKYQFAILHLTFLFNHQSFITLIISSKTIEKKESSNFNQK